MLVNKVEKIVFNDYKYLLMLINYYNYFIKMIGCKFDKFLYDFSVFRLFYVFNKIGEFYFLGIFLIRLLKFGEDSVVGRNGL